MRWYRRPGILLFDPRPSDPRPAGWFRFTAPGGLRGMTIAAHGSVRAWADGEELDLARIRKRDDGGWEYEAKAKEPFARSVRAAIRVEEERGFYGGAAIAEPVALHCEGGLIEAGDWSRIDGLAYYSGGVWYRKTVTLDAARIRKGTVLDLGGISASAEVHVNGKLAGIRVAPPWRIDVSDLIRAGENRIEVLVYNTLANHYGTIPTRYRGSPVSGLLGPVRIVHEGREALEGAGGD